MNLLPPALTVHRALLEKWRGAMDLVGPGPVEPHFEDAIASVEHLTVTGTWADLGSGAGFPGIALAALHPGATVHLVERRQKRATFLEEVVRQAPLPNAKVLIADAETLPTGSYDGVISRAYKPPAEVAKDARRLLRPGGTLVLLVAQEDPGVPDGFAPLHVKRYEIDRRPRRAVALLRTID